MSDRIKRLARKMEGIIPYPDNLQHLYDNLGELMFKQKDYFEHINPVDRIKLLFYIWSIKLTKDFAVGEDLLNRISFAHLFYTEGSKYVETCDECGGNGYERCDVCDGTGKLSCDECDGSGEVDCTSCDGDGREMGDNKWEPCSDCEGTGKEACSDCDGNGEVNCNGCGGDGDINCNSCGGDGDIQTDEFDYNLYFICTWSKSLQERCELTENTLEPAVSEYTFDELRPQYIILSLNNELHLEFVEEIEVNEVYCINYTDNPRLINIYRGVTANEPSMLPYQQ
jgi:hypothetical protein